MENRSQVKCSSITVFAQELCHVDLLQFIHYSVIVSIVSSTAESLGPEFVHHRDLDPTNKCVANYDSIQRLKEVFFGGGTFFKKVHDK